MAKKPRCRICDSKRWHRDQLSGSVVCEEGHLLQGYVQESTESQEVSQFVTQTRRVRKNKAKKLKPPSNDHFHGERALFLRWQALQFILRQQLRVLIDNLGFPEELEHVCRDLFAMLVASSGVPAAPRDFERGDEPASSFSGPREGTRYKKARKRKADVKGKGRAKEEDEESGSDDDEEEEEDERDRARRGGERSSGDEDDSEDDDPSPKEDDKADDVKPAGPAGPPDPYDPGKRSSKQAARKSIREVCDRPRIDFLLLLLYLGCVTLRVPILLKDILDLAETYQIPYLNARLGLPLEMQLHLNLGSAHILNPSIVPRAGQNTGIQHWLSRLVRLYQDDWNVRFPEANLPVLSWRICRSLALPPIIYVSLKRLLSLLPPFSFDLPAKRLIRPDQLPTDLSFAPELGQDGFKWPHAGWRPALPEVFIIGGLVVLLELLHGGVESESARKVLRTLPPAVEWVEALEEIERLSAERDGGSLLNKEVASLTSAEIDSYLTFFEDKIVPPHHVPAYMDEIDRHFPPPSAPPAPTPPEPLAPQLDALLSTLFALPRPSSPPPPISAVTTYAASLIGFTPDELVPMLSTMRELLEEREERFDGARETRAKAHVETQKRAKVERDARWKEEKGRRKALGDAVAGRKVRGEFRQGRKGTPGKTPRRPSRGASTGTEEEGEEEMDEGE